MERIVQNNIVDQYLVDKQKYALFVNKIRSTPSIKDGLKSVHRRVLYAAYNDIKCISENSIIKSATLVGAVMGKYHPHGDTAIYDAIKPMVNWFEINKPLFTGVGNWGTFQGDKAAAMRYTEIYMNKFGYECIISDLAKSKNVVDWDYNFDESTYEPQYLPVAIPNLLINGSFGIGYGLQCSVPTHNLGEVIDATIGLIKNPNHRVTLIPDQCMPCDIIEADWDSISNVGLGKFKVRGRVEISEITLKGITYPALKILSIPDGVYLNNIRAKIIKLIDDDKALPQVLDIIDKSTHNPKTQTDEMKYFIVLKKGSDPYYVRDVLYKSTSLENTINVSMQVLDGIESILVGYTEYLKYFINFRINTKIRYNHQIYRDADTLLHEREAFIKVLKSGEVDNIINMIKKRKTTDDTELVEYLIKKLDITDLQAKYIINANLKKLSLGYLNKYIDEAKGFYLVRQEADSKLRNPEILKEEIIEELLNFKAKYNTPRKSRVVKASDINNIPEGEFYITITENNNMYKTMNPITNTLKGDSVKLVKHIQNTESLLIFDTIGRVFKLPVHKLPITDKQPVDLRMVIKSIGPVMAMMNYEKAEAIVKKYKHPLLLVISNNGFIKKLELETLLSAPSSGFAYINLESGDMVSSVILCDNSSDIIVFTGQKALRINIGSVPIYKRNAKGVKTINSKKNFVIDGISILNNKLEYICIVTENGMINKIPNNSLAVTDRNKAGQNVIKLNKNDKIKWIVGVNDNNVLNITSSSGQTKQIPVSDIKIGSSISTGKQYLPKREILLNLNIT